MSAAGTPTWYDLLDLDPRADDAQVRAAWRAAIADLDPGERRFRACNAAAEVLLDPERRAAYDAELAAAHAEEDLPAPDAPDAPEASDADAEPAADPVPAAGSGRPVPRWLLVVVALLAAGAVTAAGVLATRPSDADLAAATRAARAAAETAVVPVLSYDGADLDASRAAAVRHLTPAYRTEYDQLFDGVVEQNAPRTGTVVQASVVRSGLVRADAERAEVLVMVDQTTTNKTSKEPTVIKYWVTMTMERVDGDWLVGAMRTRA